MREQLIKYAGYFGNLFGTSVRKAEARQKELPELIRRADDAIKDAEDRADILHEKRRYSSYEELMAASDRALKKSERAIDAIAARERAIRQGAATSKNYKDANEYYYWANSRRNKYEGKILKELNAESDAASARLIARREEIDNAVKKVHDQKHDLLSEQNKSPSNIADLRRDRAEARFGTAAIGLPVAGFAASMYKQHRHNLAQKAVQRRDALLGAGIGAGAAGLGGLAMYRKKSND